MIIPAHVKNARHIVATLRQAAASRAQPNPTRAPCRQASLGFFRWFWCFFSQNDKMKLMWLIFSTRNSLCFSFEAAEERPKIPGELVQKNLPIKDGDFPRLC